MRLADGGRERAESDMNWLLIILAVIVLAVLGLALIAVMGSPEINCNVDERHFQQRWDDTA